MIVVSKGNFLPKPLRSKSNFSLPQRARVRFALTSYMRKYGLSYQATCDEIWDLLPSDLSGSVKDKTQVEDFVKGSEPRDDKIRTYSAFLKAVDPEYAAFLFEDDLLEKVTTGINSFAYGTNASLLDASVISTTRANQISGFYVGIRVGQTEPELISIFAHTGTNIFTVAEYEWRVKPLRQDRKDDAQWSFKSLLTSFNRSLGKVFAKTLIGEREIILSDQAKENRKYINIALDGELGEDLPEEMDHPSELAQLVNSLAEATSVLFDNGSINPDDEVTRLRTKSSGFACFQEFAGLVILRDSYRPRNNVGYIRTSLIDFAGAVKMVLEFDTIGISGPKNRDIREPTKSCFVRVHSKVLEEFLLRIKPIRL